MREKEFKTMQEDLQYHKDKHEHYRARCDVQEKVRASPAILQWTASMTKKTRFEFRTSNSKVEILCRSKLINQS